MLDLPRIFCVISADIDADAGYNVLSMSKNTTYFRLLSVTVAMIPGDWSRAVGWLPILELCTGLEVTRLEDTQNNTGGVGLEGTFFVFLIRAPFQTCLFLFGTILHETSFQKVFLLSSSLRFPIFPINRWCYDWSD